VASADPCDGPQGPAADRVARLEADRACRALVLATLDAVDGQDYRRLCSLFTPGARLLRPGGAVLVGREAIFQAYAARDPDRLTRHLACNHHIDFVDARRAVSRCTIVLWSGRHGDAPTPQGRPADALQQVGEIVDRLVLGDEGWRIDERESRFTLFR
jgi:hypothetical protein